MNEHPIPIVRVILEDSEGKILLLKRINENYGSNQWCLPGGKVDYNQEVQSACVRELKEETNLDICDLEFLFYQDNLPQEIGKGHYINLYFSAKYSGSLSLDNESSKAVWVKPSEISNYDIAFKNDEAIIKYLSIK